MALTPAIEFPAAIQRKRPALRTYRLDFETGEIGGRIDGTEAIRQLIHKAVQTIRYQYPIYSEDYGCEIRHLLGKPYSQGFIQVEMVRMIVEALVYDERIERAYDFTIHAEDDEVYVAFSADTVQGTIRYEGTV
jgi:phage baseplate assembly protein W